jgi:hypothetical protein
MRAKIRTANGPGFELTLLDSGEYKTPRKFSDSDLTFPTKEEAEAASDATAREWCGIITRAERRREGRTFSRFGKD